MRVIVTQSVQVSRSETHQKYSTRESENNSISQYYTRNRLGYFLFKSMEVKKRGHDRRYKTNKRTNSREMGGRGKRERGIEAVHRYSQQTRETDRGANRGKDEETTIG